MYQIFYKSLMTDENVIVKLKTEAKLNLSPQRNSKKTFNTQQVSIEGILYCSNLKEVHLDPT